MDKKYAKLIIKDSLFGNAFNEDNVVDAIRYYGLDILEMNKKIGFFSNTHTYKIYGLSQQMQKLRVELVTMHHLDIKLLDWEE